MTDFVMKLAGVTIRVSTLFESTREFCRDFLVSGDDSHSGAGEVLRVVSTQEAIDAERVRSERSAMQKAARTASENDASPEGGKNLKNGRCSGTGESAAAERSSGSEEYSDAYLETLAVYRQIAEGLISRGVLLVHGSAVCVDGRGYLFTARSGVGKSTHVRFWREVLPSLGHEVRMINDDKPLLRFTKEGVFVCGTPWMGKHRLGENLQVPLAGICYLERGGTNRTQPMTELEIWQILLIQSYRPEEPAAAQAAMRLLDRLVHEVPFCHLYCNMDPQAAEVSWEGLQEAARQKA